MKLKFSNGFDYVKQDLDNLGIWEKRTTEYIEKHLKVGQTFTDVGAHVGYYTILASMRGAAADFTYSETKDDYYLYLGRVISKKGIFIAQQVCEKLNKRLVVAGFGYDKDANASDTHASRITSSSNRYAGIATNDDTFFDDFEAGNLLEPPPTVISPFPSFKHS